MGRTQCTLTLQWHDLSGSSTKKTHTRKRARTHTHSLWNNAPFIPEVLGSNHGGHTTCPQMSYVSQPFQNQLYWISNVALSIRLTKPLYVTFISRTSVLPWSGTSSDSLSLQICDILTDIPRTLLIASVLQTIRFGKWISVLIFK
jgi:hypothetical protein